MEICQHCRRPVRDEEVVWRTRQTCKQSHSSPAEYEPFPLCVTCDDHAGDYAEWCEEQRSLKRYSPEQRERV